MRMMILMAAAAIVLPGAASAQIEPGQWQITTTVQSIDMPGAPPGIAAALKGKPTVIKQCITVADAARGPQDMMKANKSCRFTRYSMKAGPLDSVMVCQQGGSTMTATSSGTFTPTSFTATGKSVTTGGHAMSVTATTAGKRIGACK